MESILKSLEGPVFSALRPYITPYTSTLPAPIHDPLLTLLTPACYNHLIRDFDPAADPSCVQLALSKSISMAILSLSTVVKLPQLIKLLSSSSAQGLSFTSYLLETASYACTLAYNFRSGNPFSTYGEIAMIAVQNIVIGALILQFSGKSAAAGAWVAAVAAAAYALFNDGVMGKDVLKYLQAATIPLGLASKIPQIVQVARRGSTGQLSAFAVFNYLSGSLARVFTTMSEVKDPLILWAYVGGAVLNAVLAAQMVWYWSAPSTASVGSSSPSSGKKGGNKKFYVKQKGGVKRRA